MNNNLILIIILLACLIASLIWKNVSDNKKSNSDTAKLENLIGARAIYKKQEGYLINKLKEVNNKYDQLVAEYNIEKNELNQTISDLHRKMDELKKGKDNRKV